jgi:2',3'-cyclic-nucleotide 2'-phosphodiesterase (5'-nucleotidase family)
MQRMKKVKQCRWLVWGVMLCTLPAVAQSNYQITSIEVQQVLMDSTWEAVANPEMTELVLSYKSQLDSTMNERIGTVAQTMVKGMPQSLLSNFSTDAMKAIGESLWGSIDFAVVNNGGLRASISAGPLLLRNLYETYPFENSLVLLELPGTAVQEFFDFLAAHGGEGMSSGVQLVAKDKKVASLLIGGQPLDLDKTYRVATLDYLAEGNSGMTAFTKATHLTASDVTLRELMIEYVKELTANSIELNASLDDRITIQ